MYTTAFNINRQSCQKASQENIRVVSNCASSKKPLSALPGFGSQNFTNPLYYRADMLNNRLAYLESYVARYAPFRLPIRGCQRYQSQ